MPASSRDLQFREMKDTISELNKTVKSLRDTIAAMTAQQEEITRERDNLKEQVDYLFKKAYGSSSEKGKGQCPGQYSLFNEAEEQQDPALAAEMEELATEAPAAPKPRKPRKTNADRFKGLPVEKIYLDVPEDQRFCDVCGTMMERIGEEFVRRELEFIPQKVKVKEYYSVNYGCPVCKESADSPQIKKGKDGRAHTMHGMASPQTVAWVMYQKYFNGMPLYRQEASWKQAGAQISRATLANWVVQNSEFFKPMYDYFHRKLLERQFLMADETPVQVLHEPDRRAQTKSYMWVYRSGEDEGPPIILYKYSETRAGYNAVDFLDGYSGYLMCDGYSGYNKLTQAKRTACYAHIRRYFIDAIPKGKDKDYSQPAVQGVIYINRLFELDKEIKNKHKSFDAIKNARLEKEKPVIEGFLSWLEKQKPVKGSRMDKAVIYARNRIPYLMTYLEDGRCSLSNNPSENSIRPFVVGRKGWLFSDRPVGAEASALCYTMVEMAKANVVNVYYYLTYLLEHLPEGTPTDEQLERLSPWNESVKEEVERMALAGY